MTSASTRLTLWSAPLLLSLLAACGGSDDEKSTNVSSSSSAEATASFQAPAVGTLLNSTDCELKYYYRVANTGSGTDPRLREQWYLNNTAQYNDTVAGEDLNVQGAWSAAGKGENIRVAVIDDGLELTHDDLAPNVINGASYNYISGRTGWARGSVWPMPCASDDTHGTAVGGIIAARDNNGIGVSGVAPRASLVGYNSLATNEDSDVLSSLIRDTDITHIYNNSWGATDFGHATAPTPSRATFKTTIENGLKNGRGGLGSIYIFAAGNGAHDGDYSPLDGNVTLPGTLAICATNASGKRSYYSEPGPNLLVCGTSGDRGTQPAVTTAEPQNSYTNAFNGTSAAAPMVSGVAALVLQANPQLTWRDLRLVLAKSARKVDPTNSGWTTYNGYNYNHLYGFGVADAEAAVALARTWQSVGGSSTLKQCGPYSVTVNGAIPEANTLTINSSYLSTMYDTLKLNEPAPGGISSAITIPADCDISAIEHVDVNVVTTGSNGSGSHPQGGELQISLTSPAGQTSTLTVPHPCYADGALGTTQARCQGFDNFDFGLTRHIEEPAVTSTNRNWTLNAVDRVAQDTGNLQSWSLTLYGR